MASFGTLLHNPHFSLSSNPGAVIFVKSTEYEGKDVYEIKVLIGDHVYGMAPKFAK